MRFYRPATKEDFSKPFIVYSGHQESQLPFEVVNLIENGETRKAISTLRNRWHLPLPDCRRLCKEYESFAKARNDFRDGKPVFTEY